MADSKKVEYRVGYGKPPRHSQFKPGQSGNKQGRPVKIRPSVQDIFSAELRRTYPIERNGKQEYLSMDRLIVLQLLRAAAKGNQKAIAIVLPMIDDAYKADLARANEAPRNQYSREALEKMTEQERIHLYRETIVKINDQYEREKTKR